MSKVSSESLKSNLCGLILKIKSLEKDISDYWLLYDEDKIKKNDIDIILKVSDKTDIILLTGKIIPLLIEFIKENNIFIACFPVNEKEFHAGSKKSQFIKNVEQYGKK